MDNKYELFIFIIIIGIILKTFTVDIIMPIIILLIFMFLMKSKILSNLNDTVKKYNSDINDNNYNDDINNLLNKIKEFKYYDLSDYKKGKRYYKKFMKIVNKLHTIENPHNYIENAVLLLKESINHFQYIVTNIKEKTYEKSIKYNNFDMDVKQKELHGYIDELYRHSYSMLYKANKYKDYDNIFSGNVYLNTPVAIDTVNLHDLY
tara:strand:+ start:248 stop:865 length:618 start_codon:yes stop_codon:yes gene_type:complete